MKLQHFKPSGQSVFIVLFTIAIVSLLLFSVYTLIQETHRGAQIFARREATACDHLYALARSSTDSMIVHTTRIFDGRDGRMCGDVKGILP